MNCFVNKKVLTRLTSCSSIDINCFLVSICLSSLCLLNMVVFFAGDEAQPHSEPDHPSSVVLRVQQGGVPGA